MSTRTIQTMICIIMVYGKTLVSLPLSLLCCILGCMYTKHMDRLENRNDADACAHL